jgi:deoxyribodipyrimidine photo-lyase
MSSTPPVIVRFRQDLRRTDNPALSACADAGYPVLPVYILDDGNAGDWQMGAASRWWLHQSLASLNQSLGGHLRYFRGDAAVILMRLAEDLDAAGVYWNRCFEPWRIDRDHRIKAELKKNGCSVQSFNGSLLFEPQGVAKADGSPYKVFTPYYRKGCLGNAPSPRVPLEAPELMIFDGSPSGLELDELKLMPSIRWYDSIAAAWTPGETGALERLERFLDEGIRNYKEGRNRPDLENVSRLSPHLHFGEVSPHQVWHAANALKAVGELENDIDHFLSELGWREFSNYLLYHWPALPQDNLQEKFDRGLRRRCSSLLSHLQPGRAGTEIRPGRRLRAALRPGARQAPRQVPAQPLASACGRSCRGRHSTWIGLSEPDGRSRGFTGTGARGIPLDPNAGRRLIESRCNSLTVSRAEQYVAFPAKPIEIVRRSSIPHRVGTDMALRYQAPKTESVEGSS